MPARSSASRRQTEQRLAMLACGQPIAFVASLFGPAVLNRGHGEGIAEHVFYTPHALVQILADDKRVACRWSITVIDDRLALDISELTFNQTAVALGKSRFWNLLEEPNGQLLGIGAHRLTYVEAHQFGAAGANQLYLFAFNDAGVGDFDRVALQEAGLTTTSDGVFADEAIQAQPRPVEALRSFRRSTTINTLTVAAANADPRLTKLMPYGVDLEFIRVFRPSAVRSRRRRKAPFAER